MTRDVSAALADALNKYKVHGKGFQFEQYWGKEYKIYEDMTEPTNFGVNSRRQGGIIYTNRRIIGDIRSSKSSKYV